MQIDIIGDGSDFYVYDSETHKRIEVKHVTLNINKDGMAEAILYVGLGLVQLKNLPRATDGVREEGTAYEHHPDNGTEFF